MGTIVLAILIFGFIVFSHEVGHYMAARWAGITIVEFAIGMGPVIFSWTDKREIQYSLRLFPIGGFLAMEGEDEESSDPNSYGKASTFKRGVVIGAGAFVNLLCGYLALLLLANMSYVGTTAVLRFDSDAQISNQVLQEEDQIYLVNGVRTYVASDVSWQLFRSYDGVVKFTVMRDGRLVELPSVTFPLEDVGDGIMAIDIDFSLLGTRIGVGESFGYSYRWALSLMKQVWGSVVEIATGNIPLSQLSGPVGVASAIGHASRVSWSSVAQMSAFIMINIGLVNLLPLPMLDGGKLVLIFIEGITGFKLSERVENGINLVGFACLMLLMVYVTFNDILRFIK